MLYKILASTLTVLAAFAATTTQAQSFAAEVSYGKSSIDLYVGQKVNLAAKVTGLAAGTSAGCYAITPMPLGLKLDSATCTVSGTPLSARESLIRIRTRTFQESPLILNIAQYGVVYRSIHNLYVGETVSLAPQIYGLSAGQSADCSLAPWGVPIGLKIDPVTCVLSGTLSSSGNFAFVVKSRFVQDVPVVLKVARNGIVYPSSAEQLYVGQSVEIVPRIYGGLANCTVSNLPAGLTLNSQTCAITGVALQEFNGLIAIRNGLIREIPLLLRVSKYGVVYSTKTFALTNNVSVNIAPKLIGFAAGQSPSCMALNLPMGLRMDPVTCAISGTVSNTLGLNREVTIQTGGFGSQTLIFKDGN